MKQFILSSLLTSGLVFAGPAQAETMPFSKLAGNVSADTLLQLPPNYFYVMDAEAGLAWVMTEDAEFVFVAGLTAYDGEVHVLRNGVEEFTFPVDMPVTSITYDGFSPEMLPASRAVLASLEGRVVAENIGDVLPEGSTFGSMFTVTMPDNTTSIWAPEERGRGIIVMTFDPPDQRFIPIDVLESALAEGGATNE